MEHPKFEKTFVIIKPDGLQRSLVGNIISRFERVGLKIAALKLVNATEDQCWKHYNKDEAWFLKKGTGIAEDMQKQGLPLTKEPIEYGRAIIGQLVTFMTSDPVVCMVLQGNQAVAVVKKLVGSTEPATSDVGTIRGDLTLDSYALAGVDERAVRNLIHCSDAVEEAQREIQIWFTPEEILDYKLFQEQVLYDINLDGVKE